MSRARRSPRFGPFLVTGAVLGLVLAAVVAVVRRDAVDRPELTFWYLGILLAGLGSLAGGVVAVLLDRPRRRD